METIKINREVYNCKQGERNIITKEIFCNRYREFCKYIGECPIKQNNQNQK